MFVYDTYHTGYTENSGDSFWPFFWDWSPADPSDRFVFASAVSHMCRKHGELKKSTANVSVSWLFGILKVKAGYRNGQISFVPQIFGKKIDFAKKIPGRRRILRKRQKTMKQRTARQKKQRMFRKRKKPLPVLEEKTKPDTRTVSENRNTGKQGFEIRNTGW